MPATILIIDDDPDIGTLMAQLLGEEGFAVMYVDSGAAGLAALAATPPDLVLLDFRMPGMDGAAFVRESERQGASPLFWCRPPIPSKLEPSSPTPMPTWANRLSLPISYVSLASISPRRFPERPSAVA